MLVKTQTRVVVISSSGASPDASTATQTLQVLLLPHPKSGEKADFVLRDGAVLEVTRFKQQYSSWFVGDGTVQDGSLYLMTPVDPLLILLPIIQHNQGQSGGVFTDPEQLLACEEGGPDMAALHALVLGGEQPLGQQQAVPGPTPQLGCVCDVKVTGGQRYYRLNEQRVAAWLYCKTRQACDALLQRSISSFGHMDSGALRCYALGMLGEYLADGWVSKVAKQYGIPEPGSSEAHAVLPEPLQPVVNSERPPEKRVKLDPKELQKRKAAEARKEAKAAALAKETRGMKKMSAFFTKKPPASP